MIQVALERDGSIEEHSKIKVILTCDDIGAKWEKYREEKILLEIVSSIHYCHSDQGMAYNQSNALKDIEIYLNSLIMQLQFTIWKCPHFLKLLNDGTDSQFIRSQVFALTTQLTKLIDQMSSDKTVFQETLAKVDKLTQMVDQLAATGLPAVKANIASSNSMGDLNQEDGTDSVAGDDVTVKPPAAETEPPIIVQIVPIDEMLAPVIRSFAESLLHIDHESVVTQLLNAIVPTTIQKRQREILTEYLQHQMKNTVGLPSFSTGTSAIGYWLPDDPISVTGLVTKASARKSLTSLHDALLNLTFNRGVRGTNNSPQNLVIDKVWLCEKTNELDDKPMIQCDVGGNTVFLSMNNFDDMLFATYIEEINRIVNRNDLFKRSLLLILSWWKNEASVRAQIDLSTIIGDHAIAIMLTAIFNIYGNVVIVSPLQALFLFLREFCGFDGMTQAVTYRGFLSFTEGEQEGVGGVPVRKETDSMLIPITLMQKFQPLHIGKVPKKDGTLSEGGPLQFEFKPGFCIMNPFTHRNMVPAFEAQALQGIFRTGFAGLSDCIALHCLREFFATSLRRYPGDGQPRDLPLLPITPENSEATLQRLWKNLQYANLIVHGVISEPAILSLTADILTDKGPLPIGEIGSRMVESTGIANFSQQVRMKFKGLKKFLEHYEDVFFVSKEHLFNPVIILRSTVSASDIHLLEQGTMTISDFLQSFNGAKKPANFGAGKYSGAGAGGGFKGAPRAGGQYGHSQQQQHHGGKQSMPPPQLPSQVRFVGDKLSSLNAPGGSGGGNSWGASASYMPPSSSPAGLPWGTAVSPSAGGGLNSWGSSSNNSPNLPFSSGSGGFSSSQQWGGNALPNQSQPPAYGNKRGGNTAYGSRPAGGGY